VSCAPAAVGAVLEIFRQHGFDAACEIGEITAGAGIPKLQLR